MAPVVLDVGPALGYDVDRRAVERRADLVGVEGTVVRRIVPGQPALVAGLSPERRHPLDGLDRRLPVEDDAAPRAVGLGAAEAPRDRIGPRRRVVDRVAERLADGTSLALQRGADP